MNQSKGSSKLWKNWSGYIVAKPQTILYPTSIEEVVDAVQLGLKERKYIRVVGSGHSFSPIAASNEIFVSLDKLQGIVEVNAKTCAATVWAGTKLNTLGKLLYEHKLGQENLGDIDVQSIAGAISTGTHGTGKTLGNISTQVIGLTVVDGQGHVQDYTEETHPDLFKALQLSLGILGIIVKVKLRLKPAYLLGYESMRMNLDRCIPQLPQLADENRHFEIFWFPYAETCQIKIMNEVTFVTPPTPLRDYFNDRIMENTIFGLLSQMCKIVPSLTKVVSRLSASSIPITTKADYSHRVYATMRSVRFNEMEYNIPSETMGTVIKEMRALMEKEKYAVHFPIECRYVAADGIWLSPAYERESAYIAIHMFKGMPYEKFFNDMEQIFCKYEGRPHWGKMHSLHPTQLEQLYPRWNDFLEARQQMDPHQLFLSPYMKALFNI